MNFEVFKAAKNGLNSRNQKEWFTPPFSYERFSSMLQKAIDNDDVNTFVVNTFNNLDFSTAYYNFYQFFRSMENDSKLRTSFFVVFKAVCKNISLIANYCGIKLISMICRRYFDIKFLNESSFGDFYEVSMIRFLMNNVPKGLLENIIITNFDNIIKDASAEDLQYFSTYDSWRALIEKYFEDFMELLDRKYDNFILFIKTFPEYSNKAYEYMLSMILKEEPAGYNFFSNSKSKFDLINDVLEPMSCIEKYTGYFFNIIRDNVRSIMSWPSTFSEMYAIADFLVEEFDVSTSMIDEIITDKTNILTSYLIELFSKPHNINDAFSEAPELIETLTNFFCSSKAYYQFMDNLPYLLDRCGIVLYAILITILGPIPELTKYESLCYNHFDI